MCGLAGVDLGLMKEGEHKIESMQTGIIGSGGKLAI